MERPFFFFYASECFVLVCSDRNIWWSWVDFPKLQREYWSVSFKPVHPRNVFLKRKTCCETRWEKFRKYSCDQLLLRNMKHDCRQPCVVCQSYLNQLNLHHLYVRLQKTSIGSFSGASYTCTIHCCDTPEACAVKRWKVYQYFRFCPGLS